MESDILFKLKSVSVGCRPPNDPFFTEGNDVCQFLKCYGVFEIDNEEFLHPPSNDFSCLIPGCSSSFSTLVDYDIHYNTCHRFTCAECKKKLPSPHLLDLHVSETHDSYFSVQAERKPMYKCYVESCKELFKDGHERRSHCIQVHKFPSDFRFDDFRKKKHAKAEKLDTAKDQSMETDQTLVEINKTRKKKEKESQINSEIAMNTNSTFHSKKNKDFKNICFGRGRGSGRVFSNFSKDMLDNLPSMNVGESSASFQKNKEKTPTIYQKLIESISHYFLEHNISLDHLREVPKKWEKYNDFILVDNKYFQNQIWREIDILNIISKILNCKRIGIKNKISNDNFRSPNVEIILGSSEWVTFNDNGIKYTWNVYKSMFSSGNISERHRISHFNCEHEVIVDLYAGIGYFTLPYLVYTKCQHLYACEWNPYAVEALKKNVILNNVSDRCTVLEGDNASTCPKAFANRVNMGLLPDCEKSWRTACLVLKNTGGILHLHGNVDTKLKPIHCSKCLEQLNEFSLESIFDEGLLVQIENGKLKLNHISFKWKHQQWLAWCIHVLHSLLDIIYEIYGCPWNVSCFYLHSVKSYAPFVDHLVLDIKLSP